MVIDTVFIEIVRYKNPEEVNNVEAIGNVYVVKEIIIRDFKVHVANKVSTFFLVFNHVVKMSKKEDNRIFQKSS